MAYQIEKHTADIRLKLSGRSYEAFFKDGFRAVMEYLSGDLPKAPTTIHRPVSVKAVDPSALIVDFLNEVISLAYVNKEIYSRIGFTHLSETGLSAVVHGNKVKAFVKDIKAVTYHEARVIYKNGSYQTNLVIDI